MTFRLTGDRARKDVHAAPPAIAGRGSIARDVT